MSNQPANVAGENSTTKQPMQTLSANVNSAVKALKQEKIQEGSWDGASLVTWVQSLEPTW